MKKTFLLKTMLLLCALVAGSASGWAEDVDALSWSRSGATDNYSTGFTFAPSEKAAAKDGFYQDSGTKNSTIVSIALYHPTTKLFATTPLSVTFTAKLGGGSAKDPLNYNVYACFVDKDGNNIADTEVTVTTKITDKNGSDFIVNMSTAKATDAYGVKIYHMKEDGWNVRYYGFSLSYEAAAPAYSITAASNDNELGTVSLTGNVITATPAAGSRYADPAYTVTIGTATVAQSGNIFTITPSTDCTVCINFETIPTYAIKWSVNGTIVKSEDVAEGEAISFDAPASGIPTSYSFMGWVTEANKIDTPTDTDPSANYVTSATCEANITYYAVMAQTSGTPASCTEIALADLTESDVFVIVGNNGDTYAMSNDNGTTNPPAAVDVTVEGSNLTSDIPNNIKWNVSGNASDGYIFYPNGDDENWLYCTNTNNGVRVGTNENKTFNVSTEGYLIHDGTSRYVGIYNSQNWRCYGTINSNITGQTFKFYKYTAGSLIATGYCTTVPPVIAVISAAGYATFSAPYAVDFSATDVEVYTAAVNGDKVMLTAVDSKKVPANTAVILKGETVTGTVIASADALEDNELLVSDGTVVGNGSIYVLAKKDAVGFYKLANDVTIPAGKCYLDTASSAPEFLGFSFGGETTGISQIENGKLRIENVYNLNGQRVAQPSKGLYIMNGRKVVIK